MTTNKKAKQSPAGKSGRATKGTNPEEQLAQFIEKFVYDNYNALAIGFGPTERSSEAIFSMAVFPRWVSLFFLQAQGLPDPEKVLKGNRSVARHVVLSTPAMLDEAKVRDLMESAIERAKVPFDTGQASACHPIDFRQATIAAAFQHQEEMNRKI
jgi:hypothetical protein